MSEWNPVDELPPRQYRYVSADVVVRKRNGKEMIAYYLFPRQKWIAKESGEEIPRGKIAGWRIKDEKKAIHKPKRNEPGIIADVGATESSNVHRCSQ